MWSEYLYDEPVLGIYSLIQLIFTSTKLSGGKNNKWWMKDCSDSVLVIMKYLRSLQHLRKAPFEIMFRHGCGTFFFFFCLKLLGSYFPHHKLSWSSYFIFSKSQNGTESVFSFVLLPRWWRAIFKKNNFFYKKKKSKKTVNVFHFFLFVFKGKELGTKMFRVLVSYLYSRKIH